MTRKLLAAISCAALLTVSLACRLLGTPQAANPTLPPIVKVDDLQATAPAPSATIDYSIATQVAEEQLRATQVSALATQAAAQAAQATAEQATAEYLSALAQTAEIEQAATVEAQSMAKAIETLYADGLLEDTAGTYTRVEEFTETWAQLNWYQWWETGLSPSDFVIRAHTEWESASKTANWFASGCGFVFREADEENHYMIYLALDGNVYMKGYVDGEFRELGREYAGGIDHLKGGADVMLVVEGSRIVYFVNGEKVLQRENSELRAGNLALTLVSGTNKDYGTRCSITDIEVWQLAGQ
jgi:hypothetical protein